MSLPETIIRVAISFTVLFVGVWIISTVVSLPTIALSPGEPMFHQSESLEGVLDTYLPLLAPIGVVIIAIFGYLYAIGNRGR